MENLDNIIRKYNNELEQYFTENKVEEIHIYQAINSYNFKAYNFLISQIEVSDKNKLFKYAIDRNTECSFDILKRYKNNFNDEKVVTIYSNIQTNDDYAVQEYKELFGPESQLTRYYQDIEYQNNKELFAAMLLNESLRAEDRREILNEVLTYLLENKTDFNIKDETIVQYIVEGNYDFVCDDEYGYKKIDQNIVDNFVNIINILVEHKIKFDSDVQGYLIQIAMHNKVEQSIVDKIIHNGSNVEAYDKRVNDKNNWLSDMQYSVLQHETDQYHERIYDIYKKFDGKNKVTPIVKHVTENTNETVSAPNEVEPTIEINDNNIIGKKEVTTIENINVSSQHNENVVQNNPVSSEVYTIGNLIKKIRDKFNKNEKTNNVYKK